MTRHLLTVHFKYIKDILTTSQLKYNKWYYCDDIRSFIQYWWSLSTSLPAMMSTIQQVSVLSNSEIINRVWVILVFHGFTGLIYPPLVVVKNRLIAEQLIFAAPNLANHLITMPLICLLETSKALSQK